MSVTLCVRPADLVQETLLVLNDCRASVIAESDALATFTNTPFLLLLIVQKSSR